MRKVFNLAIIAGEESGDLLGADLVACLKKIAPHLELRLIGIGGEHLAKQGLQSFFPISEISLMGIGEVLVKLPKLLYYINRLTKYLLKQELDCLLIIDSPDFTHRVAKKIKRILPTLPIIQYIAPSVWAWRAKRAQKMRFFIDHLLVILPFEVECMKKLNGPDSTYVGHKLLYSEDIKKVLISRGAREHYDVLSFPTLLLLPGSRRFEIKRLMPLFGKMIDNLLTQVPLLQIKIVTLPRLYEEISKLAKNWQVKPIIEYTEAEKWKTLAQADIALAASGTALLELALCDVPSISVYKMDLVAKVIIKPQIKIWSAALPNIIAGKPIIPEFYNDYARAENLAHQVQYLLENKYARKAQLASFADMRTIMQTPEPAGVSGAKALLKICGENLESSLVKKT
ncbi:lipid-A-disaccharide synthase [Bartonella sp. TP]|uniref:lipid-A-disaccharide synthase n=1 Tax=Bartonella sp. TP TaxID=3057550 RepID=UPI0025B118E3|nr:lipid-A-disaccharide synthase [Bartonella sp. TP]MDN5248744.1 lipid-A-disaccharide synthase [Alphaproteobacteria bacterium]WJW79881.1 lipid-A-disaccharide synthase [Bartonella sp. TP]